MMRYLPLLPLLLILHGPGTDRALAEAAPVRRDLSGHWEMDYGRSDNVDRKLNRLYHEWQTVAKRSARGDERAAARAATLGANFRRTMDLARLADMITSSQVLEIEQSADDIEIRRENTFTLTCVFDEGKPQLVIDDLGSEVCGWDAHQLVFRIRLPDGLDIQHRVSVSDDNERLHIATRVAGGKAAPFTLNRFYFRFEPIAEDYQCEYTLSRGNVCQTRSRER